MILYLWIRIRHPDPDPRTQMNPDPHHWLNVRYTTYLGLCAVVRSVSAGTTLTELLQYRTVNDVVISKVHYSTVQYSTVQYSTVQYSTVNYEIRPSFLFFLVQMILPPENCDDWMKIFLFMIFSLKNFLLKLKWSVHAGYV